jgi:hypothetical protein
VCLGVIPIGRHTTLALELAAVAAIVGVTLLAEHVLRDA